MTWHQWQDEYPTLSSTGTPRSRASAKASADQGHQSTGLSACWSRYGDVSWASRFGMPPILPDAPPAKGPCGPAAPKALRGSRMEQSRSPVCVPGYGMSACAAPVPSPPSPLPPPC